MSTETTMQPAPLAATTGLATAMAAAHNPKDVERLERLDQAWYQSGGSVVATARRMNAPYGQTLRTLSSPQVGHLPPDDPRVFAHTMALANVTDGASRTSRTPKEEVQIATEKAAMAHLASNPNHELAHRNLTLVAEGEIVRDARMLQQHRTAEQAPSAAKRGTQQTR
jgi:hypothetical protein